MGTLYRGDTIPDAIYRGATLLDAVYRGAEQVWPPPAPPVYYDFLTVTGTSWTQAGDGEVSVRISRAIINPPDQHGNTPPTFVAGDYWRLTNESQGGAVVAEGPLNSVDDTTDPGWIRLQWAASIPNIAVAGETWRLTPVASYINVALGLGADIVVDGASELVSGSPLNGTNITLDTGPDGLTAITYADELTLSVPVPELGADGATRSMAAVIRVPATPNTPYVEWLTDEPFVSGILRYVRARNNAGNLAVNTSTKSNQAVALLNITGVVDGAWALVVVRIRPSTFGDPLALDVRYAGVSEAGTDNAPDSDSKTWTASYPQKLRADANLHLAGLAMWHGVYLSDADIDTLHAALPSV